MSAEDQIDQLRAEIDAIKERNKRVEADKGWETSKTRSIFVAIVTFTLAFLLMTLIEERQAFLKALAGSLAYLASTTTYGILKNWWLRKLRKEKLA